MRWALAAILLAACTAFAGLVSDESKMFFTGGEWLPDEVSNAAIYDGPGGTNKTLRITTNVTAGVWSTASGMFERAMLPGELWYWPTYTNGVPILCDDICSNDLQILSEAYYLGVDRLVPFWEASNRVIKTARLIEAELPRQAVFQSLLDLTGAERFGSAQAYFGSTNFDAQLSRSSEFPTWGWSGTIPRDILTTNEWAEVWPQYSSCTNDTIWKRTDAALHPALSEALLRFDEDDTRDFAYNVAATNTTPASCFALLEARFGEAAHHFTNETLRLDYSKLGTLEYAVGTMNRTYMVPWWNAVEWIVFDRYPRRYKDASCTYNLAAPDFVNGKIQLPAGGEWSTEAGYGCTTNNWGTFRQPFYFCTGDTPLRSAVVWAEGPEMTIGYQTALELLQHAGGDDGNPGTAGAWVEVDLSASGNAVVGNTVDIGWGTMPQGTHSFGTELLAGPWQVTRTASIVRETRCTWTTGALADTNAQDVIVSPHRYAWMELSPVCVTHSLERRTAITNWCQNVDRLINDGFYHPEIGYTNEYRSVRLHDSTHTNALHTYWRSERRVHNNHVHSLFLDYYNRSPENMQELLTIPDSALNEIIAKADDIDEAPLSYTLHYQQLQFIHNGDGTITCYTLSTSGVWDEFIFTEATTLAIASVGASAEATLSDSDGYIRPLPAFEAWGDLYPALDFRWKFRNLHEE